MIPSFETGSGVTKMQCDVRGMMVLGWTPFCSRWARLLGREDDDDVETLIVYYVGLSWVRLSFCLFSFGLKNGLLGNWDHQGRGRAGGRRG